MKFLSTTGFILIIFIIFPSWKPLPDGQIERPREAWVMKSVLDSRPRMLSIALNENLYVAYNTQTAALYKAWKGTVNYDGSAYNGVHGFQPTSQGNTFMVEPDTNPWKIILNGKAVIPEVSSKGHVIRNNQVTLKYELLFAGEKVLIEEKPEYTSVEKGKIGLERVFVVSGGAPNVQVVLAINLSSLSSAKDFTTDGKFKLASSVKESIQGKQFLNVSGSVVLNNDKPTNLSTFFTPRPEKASENTVADPRKTVQTLIERSDCGLCHNETVKTVGPAYASIAAKYSNESTFINRLAIKVINGGAGNWGSVPMTPHPELTLAEATDMVSYIMTYKPDSKPDIKKAQSLKKSPSASEIEDKRVPGDGHSLEAVHPTFDLTQARPAAFNPKVGGMDFLADGRLVVSTWDSLGSVYLLEGLQNNDPEMIRVKRIAMGLAEPLGVKVVDNEIYVMQKQELTKLVDIDHDDVIDEYQTICNKWKVSDNFHEFAFGLVYKDGYFYGTLATAINNGGASTQPQIPDRGKVVKISRKDGSLSFIATGLRTPNGIGLGVDNEVFIADNQGDWLPANKIVHLREGAWYGSRSVDFEGTKNLTETQPVAWLQQNDIGNSPSQPAVLNTGPYQNQMIHGDVTHGGIKRVFAEKVNDVYQGAVFRFSQGLEGGVNRLVWGPDGALYIGEVGLKGNWGQTGKLMHGLQKLTYNGKSAFEMLAIRAKSNGIEIEFTEPIKNGAGNEASDYGISQWYYTPTANYGGPKMGEKSLKINNIKISFDRRKVFLELEGMKEKHVVYVKLNRKSIVNTAGENLWSTEAWYTMSHIPGKKEVQP